METIIFTCPCGASVDYENPMQGAMNIGHFKKMTGWFSLYDRFTCDFIWTCPKCAKAALKHAEAIAAILGTGDVVLQTILSIGVSQNDLPATTD